jgi:hypothetical protein
MEHIENPTDEALFEKLQDHQKERDRVSSQVLSVDPKAIEAMSFLQRSKLRELIHLGKVLGSELAYALFDVFDGIDKDKRVMAGAPDLLIWSMDDYRFPPHANPGAGYQASQTLSTRSTTDPSKR